MAELIQLILGLWQTAVAIIAIIIAINAGIQYRKKKSKVAMHLFIAFIIISIAGLTQFSPVLWDYFFDGVAPVTNIAWFDKYIIEKWHSFQYAYYFLALGVYFLYLFSLDLIFVDKPRWGARIVPALYIAAVVVYGMFILEMIDTGGDFVLGLITGIDIWVGIFIIVLMIPLIVDLLRVRGRLDKEDPMRKRFMYLVIFAASLIVMIICFVVESFVPPFVENTNINVFSFAAWIFAVLALYFSYAGLYSKRFA